MPLRAVLFDLFGTVVHFAPRPPGGGDAAQPARTGPLDWLRESVEGELPEVGFDALLPALLSVSEEIGRDRAPEYVEVPSRERFRRALERAGVDERAAPGIAERLSLVHMAHLASITFLPAGHGELLAKLRRRYRLALVSNFDHGATARSILTRHGVADCFDVVVISEECGRRKPHPAIFSAALQALGVGPEEALFVGDSFEDDVAGAHAAGIEAVWIHPIGEHVARTPAPRHVIAGLPELRQLLL